MSTIVSETARSTTWIVVGPPADAKPRMVTSNRHPARARAINENITARPARFFTATTPSRSSNERFNHRSYLTHGANPAPGRPIAARAGPSVSDAPHRALRHTRADTGGASLQSGSVSWG